MLLARTGAIFLKSAYNSTCIYFLYSCTLCGKTCDPILMCRLKKISKRDFLYSLTLIKSVYYFLEQRAFWSVPYNANLYSELGK